MSIIVLNFVIDELDIQEANEFMKNDFPSALCENLCDWIPTAQIEFSINDVWMMDFRFDIRLPVLEFATKLNEIVHTIKVGEKRVIDITLSGDYSRFLLLDEQTIAVNPVGYERPPNNCALMDLQVASELFCSQLYDQILKLFPGYFEMMDRLLDGAEKRAESASERTVRRLFMRS